MGARAGIHAASFFVTLDGLPLNENGKIDRKALPDFDVDRMRREEGMVPARTPAEHAIVDIWTQMLSIPSIGVHTNFFELGGHSLLAIQLVTEIRAELDAEVSVATLFEGPTVESLSRLINPGAVEPAAPDLSSERGARRKEQSLRRQALREQSVR